MFLAFLNFPHKIFHAHVNLTKKAESIESLSMYSFMSTLIIFRIYVFGSFSMHPSSYGCMTEVVKHE